MLGRWGGQVLADERERGEAMESQLAESDLKREAAETTIALLQTELARAIQMSQDLRSGLEKEVASHQLCLDKLLTTEHELARLQSEASELEAQSTNLRANAESNTHALQAEVAELRTQLDQATHSTNAASYRTLNPRP